MLRFAVVERSSHARGLAAAGFAVVLTALAGACGQASDPPMLGGSAVEDAGDDGGGGGLSVADAGPPACNVGVEGGVCACVDQPLVLDPPTIYFVLDRSGSMSESQKWTTVTQVIFSVIVGLGPRADFGVTVFPDPSQDACSPGREVIAKIGGDPYPGQAGSTAYAFLKTLGDIGAPSGGTPTAATLQALASVLPGRPGKTYVVLATDGGPNCDGSTTCTAAMCTLNIEGDAHCSLSSSNCCDPSSGIASWDSCLDSQPTIDAVSALAEVGVPVYVVGLPTVPGQPEVPAYVNLLDQLAQAGGTARSGEPQYYAVSTTDAAALRTALASIAAKITGTCTLTLDTTPADPSLVNVFFDGQPVPQAGPNGWTVSGATVTILGTSCQAILSGQVLDVRVVAGCPTVTQ